MERDGHVLWAGHETEPLPPASLTKLMTALLVLERGHLDDVVVVSAAAARETGTRLGLRQGERLRARDLLTATIIRSANDACQALADHVSPDFVGLMNRRAAELGLSGTHFRNACGHDMEGHYSTAADLARLAELVAARPEYMRVAARAKGRIATLDRKRSFAFLNTNALIGRYDGALGLKTGHTSAAGNCLVALAEREGVRVLVVMLNARNRWWSTAGLLDRAFELETP